MVKKRNDGNGKPPTKPSQNSSSPGGESDPITPLVTSKTKFSPYLTPAPASSDVWEHALTELLQHPPGSQDGNAIRHWLFYHDLETMLKFLSTLSIDDFKVTSPYMSFPIFEDTSNTEFRLKPTLIKNLQALYRFVHFLFEESKTSLEHQDFDTADNWFEAHFAPISMPAFGQHTNRYFQYFLISQHPVAATPRSIPSSNASHTSSCSSSTSSSSTTALASSALQLTTFKKRIHQDVSAYPVLKDEKAFDSFHCSLMITTSSCSCADVLDPSFKPDKRHLDSMELFRQQNIFMFSVFNATLLTDMGKTIVCCHVHTMGAQKVWEDYLTYMTTSSRGVVACCELHQYLSTTVLDRSWKGTTQQFVLHYQEQFCKLHEMSDPSEHIPYNVCLIMLQHAVSAIPELAIVSTMDEFSLAVSRHTRNCLLNYETYTALLINACIHYDQSRKSKNFSKTRHVCLPY